MARDAIGLTGISMEDHKEPIPSPSALTDISAGDRTAECAGINVSRVLREALMDTLGVSK